MIEAAQFLQNCSALNFLKVSKCQITLEELKKLFGVATSLTKIANLDIEDNEFGVCGLSKPALQQLQNKHCEDF